MSKFKITAKEKALIIKRRKAIANINDDYWKLVEWEDEHIIPARESLENNLNNASFNKELGVNGDIKEIKKLFAPLNKKLKALSKKIDKMEANYE